MPKRNYPGRLTREQWLALPRAKRHDLARRGQCDVLGPFRLCTNKGAAARRHAAAIRPPAIRGFGT